MHPVVQLRAPTVAAPAVPPRMLPVTPPNIRSCGLSVTPPPVQICTPPPVPVAMPLPIAAPGSSSCWIKAFKIPDFSFRTQQAWSHHQRGQQQHCDVHSPPHMDPHQVPNVRGVHGGVQGTGDQVPCAQGHHRDCLCKWLLLLITDCIRFSYLRGYC